MRRKNGFTLVELLATIVILALVLGVAVYASTSAFQSAKSKSEDVFVKTIDDAVNMYIDSQDAKRLRFSSTETCTLKKKLSESKVYEATGSITLTSVINSEYTPITASDLINPANKEVTCNTGATVHIYRDEDMVYYYEIEKEDLNCLLSIDKSKKQGCKITNLPDSCLSNCRG